jgi:hypothetical protein
MPLAEEQIHASRCFILTAEGGGAGCPAVAPATDFRPRSSQMQSQVIRGRLQLVAEARENS